MERERGAFDAMRHARKRKGRAWTFSREAPTVAAVGDSTFARRAGGHGGTDRRAFALLETALRPRMDVTSTWVWVACGACPFTSCAAALLTDGGRPGTRLPQHRAREERECLVCWSDASAACQPERDEQRSGGSAAEERADGEGVAIS